MKSQVCPTCHGLKEVEVFRGYSSACLDCNGEGVVSDSQYLTITRYDMDFHTSTERELGDKHGDGDSYLSM